MTLLIAPLVVALIAVLASLLSALKQDELAQIVHIVAALLTGVAALLMVVCLPLVMRLGLHRNIGANLVVALLDVHLAFGYWVSWAGMLALTVVNVLLYSTPKPQKRSAYPQRVGYR